MRKDLISLLLSASLVCTMLPVEGIAREAAAAGRVAKVEKSVKKAAENADKVTAGGSFGGQVDPETGETTPDTLKWTYAAGSGLLTISGTGAMPAYTSTTYEDAPWYRYRSGIKKVVFTGDVTSVGDYAFYNDYYELATVDISAATKLTSVGRNGFAGSSNQLPLKEVIGIEQLEELGSGAFYMTKLGGDISLPKVTGLTGGNEFGDTEITGISMEGLTAISGYGSFTGCTNLESVNMPELVTISGNNVFQKSALKAIELPKLTEITGEYTFYLCTSLTEASMPMLTTTTASKQRVFGSCTSLQKVNLPKLQSAGRYFFEDCSSLTKVELPELTSIGQNPFKGDISLVSASLPKITSVPSFESCLALVYFDIPEGVLKNSIGQGKFTICDSLQRIYTHETPANNISADAMKKGYTPSIEEGYASVYLDSTVYVPSEEAEGKWSAYTSKAGEGKVVVTEDYSSLPKESSLIIKAKDYDAGSPADPEVVENTSGGEVTYKYYEKYSDSNNNSLARMKLLDQRPTAVGTYYVQASTEAVDGRYFATTSNFSQFTIYGEVGDESGKWAYNNKTNALIIKDASVVAADYESGSAVPWNDYMYDIKKVELADGVDALTEIGDYAFNDCRYTTDIPVASELTRVGASAFNWCREWNRSEPLSIRAIGANAFRTCRALASDITLESGITSVPQYAFNGCVEVKKISVPDTVTEFGAGCFSSCAKLAEIHIPEGVTALPNQFFAGTGVSEVKIPDQVTSIGDSAFKGLTISSLTLPPHLESLGASAFENCERLNTVELPASLATLKAGTFASATGLKQVIIPDTVTKIEGSTSNSQGLFYGAKNLELVIFEKKDYTAETLGTSGRATDYATTTNNQKDVKGHVIDQMFQNTNDKVQVICDGDTYTLLDQYAKSAYINGDVEQGKYYTSWDKRASDGWTSPNILNGVSVISDLLQAEIQETKTLQEADYDQELWAALQAELTKAEALPEITLDYESVSVYLSAKDDIRKGVRAFLSDTYQKCADILQSDYFDWDLSTDEGMDAWYDYEDAYDVAKDVLSETSLLTVTEYVEYEAKLRKAVKGLIPVPADEIRAEVDTLKAEVSAMNAAQYTPESWAVLQEALAEVNALPDDATISAVQAAQKKLQDAVAALVKVPGSDATATPTPAPGDSSGDGTNPTQKPGGSDGDVTNPTQKPGGSDGDVTNPTQKPGGSDGDVTNPTQKPGGSDGNTVKPTPGPGGTSNGSNTKKVTVKKVTLKKVTSKKKKTAVVQWKKLSGVTGYQVQMATDKKFKKNKKAKTVKKAKTTKVTIKKLKRKKKYYARVRAYKTVGKKKYYGKWSKVKTVKVK